MISVIVPTVTGREHWLAECKASYAAHTKDYELIVIENRPTCGEAWVEGASKAQGEFIHFSADDLQPHAGWQQAAEQVVGLGLLPAPRIVNTDQTLQSCGGSDQWNNPHENPTGLRVDFPRIPFMSRGQWEAIRPLAEGFLSDAHYWTDNVIGWAAERAGIGTAVHRGYLFTHGVAQARRGAGMSEPERMEHDYQLFQQYTKPN